MRANTRVRDAGNAREGPMGFESPPPTIFDRQHGKDWELLVAQTCSPPRTAGY
jgi:hypothetical protein